MKGFKELSKNELSALTDEQVAFLIDAECAEQGVPLMPQVPTPLSIEPIFGDVEVFCIDSSLYFASRQDAETVAQYLRDCKLLNLGYTSDYQQRIVTGEESAPPVTKRLCFSPEKWQEIRDSFERNRKKEESHKKILTEYSKIGNRRQSVAEDILKVVNDAKYWKARRDLLEASIHQYVKLAECNNELAYRYFIKAYPDAVELYPDLVRDYFPMEIAA